MHKKILIVGCGAAGWSAAFAARKMDKKAEITVVEQGKYTLYERGGIPYVIQGHIPTFETLVNFSRQYYEMIGLNVQTETKATDVSPSSKEVTVIEGSGKELRLKYDSLILATGARPFIVPVPGHKLPEVYGVRTLDDGRRILRECNVVKSAVVVGSRMVGLEIAAALKQHGLDVTVVERLPQILDGILDPELANEVKDELEETGIRFILGEGISGILGENHVTAVHAGSQKVKADMVVMATGVRGRTELAQQMGVELGETKLVKVNAHMETNIEGVFAAGDCIECTNAITGKPITSQLGANAVRQGKVAGMNAAGGSMTYPKILGACITRLNETEIGSTGLTEAYATKLGIECVSAYAKVPARPPCSPEEILVQVKLVARKADGKLIGAQIMSRKEVGPRVDTLSMAILKHATVDDLVLFDHAYSPLMADSTDPLSAVAEVLSRKLVGAS